MQIKDQELKLLNLSEEERHYLPLGYSKIYVKDISSKHAEKAVTVYSKKYGKADFFALASEKPISKMSMIMAIGDRYEN